MKRRKYRYGKKDRRLYKQFKRTYKKEKNYNPYYYNELRRRLRK